MNIQLDTIVLVGKRKGASKACENLGLSYKIWEPKETSLSSFLNETTRTKVIAVIATKESTVLSAVELRTSLTLSQNHEISIAMLCRDKFEFKKWAILNKIPTAKWILLDEKNVNDVSALQNSLGRKLVVKERTLSGSRGLLISNHSDSLLASFKVGKIVEEFIEGRESSIESFIFNGEIIWTNITYYYQYGRVNIVPGDSFFTQLQVEKILELNKSIIEKMAIPYGMTHLEFFLKDDEIFASEIAWRPPGGHIMKLIKYSYDFSPWETYILLHLNKRPEVSAAKINSLSLIIHPGEGVIEQIERNETFEDNKFLKEKKFLYKKSDYLPARMGLGDEFGHCIWSGEKEDILNALNNFEKNFFIKLKQAKIIEGKVETLSKKGHGIVKTIEGKNVLIPGTWPGDRVQFVINENSDSREKYCSGRLINILTPSENRQDILCTHLGFKVGKCSGCPWMIANYQSQLDQKNKRVLHLLSSRRKIVDPSVIKNIVASPKILSYRNRIQLKTDGSKIGLVSEGSSVLAPIKNCLIVEEKIQGLIQQIGSSLPREDWKPTPPHHWNYFDLDDKVTDISEIVLNKRRPFQQGNSSQNNFMKSWIQEKLNSHAKDLYVLELFCGSGNFTEILNQCHFVKKILAIEVSELALDSLNEKYLDKVLSKKYDLFKRSFWSEIVNSLPEINAILIDPPREGLPKRASFFKFFKHVELIIYISCDLDSFARDLELFIKNGFAAEEIIPLDTFPHTPHVEILSVLRKMN